jgi:transcription initiation factor TFIID subunit 9B
VPEVFGVRLPPAAECLTTVDFDLIPNKPPPEVKQYDEEVEEVEESESDEDEEMEQADIPVAPSTWGAPQTPVQTRVQQQAAAAVAPPPAVNPMQHPMAVQAPSDVDMGGTGGDDGSENEEDDGLFAGGEEEEESDDAMEEVQSAAPGAKRKLVEEDNYD